LARLNYKLTGAFIAPVCLGQENMNKIIISCPYNRVQDLYQSLNKNKSKGDLIISDKDVSAVYDDSIYIGENAEKHSINSFSGSFIRYPYDLINPHTETYQKREGTEFLKTLALLFDQVGINSIQKAHFARNRLYSLFQARESGLKTAESIIIKNGNVDFNLDHKQITKSLGNCYFSNQISEKEAALRDILSFEEDGNDTAYIYKPHLISDSDDIQKHTDNFGTCFLQNMIEGEEYRVFVVDGKIFAYKRKEINSFDKSSAGLVKAPENLFSKYEANFNNLSDKLGLKYLCLDIIIKNDEPIVIDVNPFGSFPKYQFHPEVVDTLSLLLLGNNHHIV